jgi:hypothetical protein
VWIVDDLSGLEIVPCKAVVDPLEPNRTFTEATRQGAIPHLSECRTTLRPPNRIGSGSCWPMRVSAAVSSAA